MVFPIAGGTQDTGYEISNSLRFNDDDSAKLGKDFSSTETSDKTKTLSFWIKRSTLGQEGLIRARTDSEDENTRTIIYFASNDTLQIQSRVSGSGATLSTSRVFRDVSAWYHLVIAFDTSQGTASNRLKIYVNGVEETSFAIDERSNISQNREIHFGNNKSSAESFIGNEVSDLGFYDGYISEFNFIDGQQLDASYFGETNNNGVWIPKAYSGTYGNNGFFLEFKQTGTSQNSSGIGADTSGNDHHFAVTNLAATDVTTDTPTNNFATMNPLDSGSGSTFSEGNLATNTGDNKNDIATIGFQNGKWYWETKCAGSGIVGVQHESVNHLNNSNLNDDVGSVAFSTYHGAIFHNNNQDQTPPNDRDGQIIGCAVDMDNDKIYWHVDGTYISTTGGQQAPSGTNGITIKTGTTSDGFYFPKLAAGTSNQTMETNFGNPTFSISSGNSDANGYGNFEYAVPSGYYALCTKNLAEFG